MLHLRPLPASPSAGRLAALAVAVLVAPAPAGLAQEPASDSLDIYWIDVEGGAATLVVTPPASRC